MPDSRIRCLLVANTFPPLMGGSSTVYENLARVAQGDIVVLTSFTDYRTGREHPSWREEDSKRPYPVRRIALVRPPLAAAATRLSWRHKSHLRMVAELMRILGQLVKTHRVQIVCIADDETVGWLVPYVKFVLRRPVLIYCHGDDLVATEGQIWRRCWFTLADAVIAASRFAFNRLTGHFGVDPSKIALIANGVDREHFRVAERSAILEARYGTKGRRVILSASRLVPRKGIDRTLMAIGMLAGRHPELLYLVAGEGEQKPELQALAAKLRLGQSVQFVGAVPYSEMPAHYALADAVVLPNRASAGDEDGLPLVFLEANACGKPVIGGIAGGTAEVVRDGVNGLLVDGDSAQAIADAIERVIFDSSLQARLAAGALEAAQQWDWESRVAAFRLLCARLAVNQAPSGRNP